MRIESPDIQPFEKHHRETVRKLIPECMVLLKNERNILPLKKAGKIALYGNGARHTVKGGTGSGSVVVRRSVSVEKGLEMAGFQVTTKNWLDQYDKLLEEAKSSFYEELRKGAEKAGKNLVRYAMGKNLPEPEYCLPLDGEGDTAVYVLARSSGEGSDRKLIPGDFLLTQTEIRDILKLRQKYQKFILILNTGGMVDLGPVKSVETILLMSQPGMEAGNALADVLCGRAYPSGKLAMTWAAIDDYPSTEGFGDPNDTCYGEGIYVGYRYFDTAGLPPVYPFGFGLGYTSFEISPKSFYADTKKVTIQVNVKNTGTMPGKEVVQVYYSAPEGLIDKPRHELAAYKKTGELLPEEEELLSISFETSSMASFSEVAGNYILESGLYYIRAGNSSANTEICGAVMMEKSAVTECVRRIRGVPEWSDRKVRRSLVQHEKSREEIEIVTLHPSDFLTEDHMYSTEPAEIPPGISINWSEVKSGQKTLDEFIGGLTEEQLVSLCIGDYKEKSNSEQIIGNGSAAVAGAAGETTHRLQDLGVPALIMADGPAGLRLSRKYKIVDGQAKPLTVSLDDDFLTKLMEEKTAAECADALKRKELPTYYQYCTAIPVGAAIAQSFNDSLAQTFGDLVGAEMEIFGIHLWLAPALNIQRSPLCGRNFEYFSEDPLVSGHMAAHMTLGVQKHKKCAVAVKHYACNNQETNRYFSSSNVSERAMREIYLKGFEICVKKAKPDFVMTSYNLINGEHVCNDKSLLTYVLRDEWGFEGVILSDWNVTGSTCPKGEKYYSASAAGNIWAGNDITMPGTPLDKEDIMRALLDRSHPRAFSKAQLQLCAKRILRMILKLTQED